MDVGTNPATGLPLTPDDLELLAQGEEALGRWAPYEPSNCAFCRHLRLEKGIVCDAFPEGIPHLIQRGDADHRLPFPGDRGIRYDPLTPADFQARADNLRALARDLAAREAPVPAGRGDP